MYDYAFYFFNSPFYYFNSPLHINEYVMINLKKLNILYLKHALTHLIITVFYLQ